MKDTGYSIPTEKDENTNPKTGVGIGFPVLLAAGAAMLCVVSRKRR